VLFLLHDGTYDEGLKEKHVYGRFNLRNWSGSGIGIPRELRLDDVHYSVAGRALARSFMLWLRSRYLRHLNTTHYLLLIPSVLFDYNNNNMG
jgi:hypothetical protein